MLIERFNLYLPFAINLRTLRVSISLRRLELIIRRDERHGVLNDQRRLRTRTLRVTMFRVRLNYTNTSILVRRVNLDSSTQVATNDPNVIRFTVLRDRECVLARDVRVNERLLRIYVYRLLNSERRRLIPRRYLREVRIRALLLRRVRLNVVYLSMFLIGTISSRRVIENRFRSSRFYARSESRRLSTSCLVLTRARLTQRNSILVYDLRVRVRVTRGVVNVGLVVQCFLGGDRVPRHDQLLHLYLNLLVVNVRLSDSFRLLNDTTKDRRRRYHDDCYRVRLLRVRCFFLPFLFFLPTSLPTIFSFLDSTTTKFFFH